MSDTDEDTAMWPGSPYALVDTGLCPSCFQTLTDTTCAHCGLVVADPRALRLLELGRSILNLEAQRQQLIEDDPARSPGRRPQSRCRDPMPRLERAAGGPGADRRRRAPAPEEARAFTGSGCGCGCRCGAGAGAGAGDRVDPGAADRGTADQSPRSSP